MSVPAGAVKPPTFGPPPPSRRVAAPPPAPAARRRRWLSVHPDVAVAVGLAAVVLATATLAMGHWPVGVFYDDGIYLILAKALATGEGYRYLNLPGTPAATHYPPGYPALLALLWTLAPRFPENVPLLKFANAVLLALAGAGAYLLARRRLGLGPVTATAAAVGGAVAIPVLTIAGVLFSEPLFLALLMPSLVACERLLDDDERLSRALLAGAMCGVLTLVRTVGIAAVAVLPWQLWTSLHTSEVPAVLEGSYGSYVGWLFDAFRAEGPRFALRVAAHNAREFARPFGLLFSPLHAPWAMTACRAAVAAVAGAGLVRLERRSPVVFVFVLAYFAIVLLWPYLPDRFLFGLWPVVTLVLVLGASAIAEWRPRLPAVPRLAARAAALAACAVLAAGYVRYNVNGFRGRWWERPQREASDASFPLARWVARHTRPTDVVATDSDPLVYLYTGRQAVPATGWTAAEYLEPQSEADRLANARTLLDTFGVKYLLVSSASSAVAPAARRLAAAKPPALTVVDRLPRGGGVFTPVRH